MAEVRLTELDPRWVRFGDAPSDAKQGITFLCPQCKKCRLGVFFDVPICGASPVDLGALMASRIDGTSPDYEAFSDVHLGSVLWHREGDTFESLTLSPSVDASAWGCWHGFITGGEIR